MLGFANLGPVRIRLAAPDVLESSLADFFDKQKSYSPIAVRNQCHSLAYTTAQSHEVPGDAFEVEAVVVSSWRSTYLLSPLADND